MIWKVESLGKFYSINTEKVLGKGSFGKVYEAQDQYEKTYAVKVITIPPSETLIDNIPQSVYAEAVAMTKLSKIIPTSPYIVYLYDTCLVDQSVLFIMENIVGRTLADKNTQLLSLEQKLGIMKQMTDAVKFLHHNNIVHLDIKPTNFILDTTAGTIIKLIDFGFSCETIDSKIKCIAKLRGTPNYIAPEMWLGKGNDINNFTALDIFALGTTFYYILTNGASIYPATIRNSLDIKIFWLGFREHNITKHLINIKDIANPKLQKLVRDMTQYNPSKRPTIDTVSQILADLG